MTVAIFYSWQSDTKAAANRTFIQQALEAAANELHADGSISVEPVVDRDTEAVPGAPDIGTTILDKIDASAVIVADVTIVNHGSDHRPVPNPNVLIEIGYALKSLGARRVILVQNVAYGGPEHLPFDLRQKRVLKYNSPEETSNRAPERRQFQAALKDALRLVLQDVLSTPRTQYPVKLAVDYIETNIHGGRHDYQLRVTLTNEGTKPITEWHVDVSMPTRLLESHVVFALRVPERSDDRRTLFRATQTTYRSSIYPNDTKCVMTIDYRVDTAIFNDLRGLFAEKVTAVAYTHGEVAATTERTVRELQNF